MLTGDRGSQEMKGKAADAEGTARAKAPGHKTEGRQPRPRRWGGGQKALHRAKDTAGGQGGCRPQIHTHLTVDPQTARSLADRSCTVPTQTCRPRRDGLQAAALLPSVEGEPQLRRQGFSVRGRAPCSANLSSAQKGLARAPACGLAASLQTPSFQQPLAAPKAPELPF